MSRNVGEKLTGLPPGCEAFVRTTVDSGQKSKKRYQYPSVTMRAYCLKDRKSNEVTVIGKNMGRTRGSAEGEIRKLICSNCPLQ
jgi:hypothetical protein